MSDQVTVALREPPWLPTADTEPVETLSHYDGPLLGVFRQHDVPYLFRCLGGELGRAQLWLYVPLTDRDVAALQSAEGAALDALVDSLSVGRQVTVALAGEARLLYAEQQDTSGLTPNELAPSLIGRVRESVATINRRTEDLTNSIW
jgi:hypothetical protein